MKKSLIFLCFVLFVVTELAAQEAVLKGKVIDKASQSGTSLGDRLGDGSRLTGIGEVFDADKRCQLHVDALPRNAMGKVQKKELREAYAGVFSDN